MTALVSPVVNLNGNDKEDLFEKARDISRALQGVLDALQRGADLAHGRNFQTLRDEGIQHYAREAYGERATTIHAMLHEFNIMALDIMRQGE
jgi:hypothetical protein